MSLTSFVEAMPKVELNIHLEGSFEIERLLLIAEQYEIPETLKHYDTWVGLLRKPDYSRIYDILRVANSWLKDGEDLSRITYDLGTHLYKQNVQYAEVGVCPVLYPDIALDLEGFFTAINDGRERAEKAWGIRMNWVLNVLRDEPRRAEDAARWVSSIPAQRAGVIGMGLVGRDDSQPAGQFERPFKAVEKRDLPRSVRVGEFTGAQGVQDALTVLNPTRVIDGRGAWESDEVLTMFAETGVAMMICGTRMVKQRWVSNAKEVPYKRYLDEGVSVVIGSDMPTVYQTNLNNEYLLAVQQGGLSIEDLSEIALAAIKHSALADGEKTRMAESFRERYQTLMAEHLETQK